MTMRSVSHARIDQRGFTLTELLVAIAIVGLIMTGLLTLLMAGNESYLAGANQVEAQAATRAALERMTQEIREAGYDPTGAGSAAVTNQTNTQFTINNDWDGSGAVQAGVVVPMSYNWGGVATNVNRGEQITYTVNLAAGTLTRQESAVDAQPQTLVTSVAQASVGGVLQPYFQYLDANGCVIGVCNSPTTGAPTTQADIRTVVVNLRVGVQNQPPAIWQAGAIQVTMSDRIRLRNR